jgi:hypothetical protein
MRIYSHWDTGKGRGQGEGKKIKTKITILEEYK